MNNDSDIAQLLYNTKTTNLKLCENLQKTFDLLRKDKQRDGLLLLDTCLGDISWLLDVFPVLNEIGVFGDALFETEEISEFLAESLEAVENSDMVLLADLIEYEIIPIVISWGDILEDVEFE